MRTARVSTPNPELRSRRDLLFIVGSFTGIAMGSECEAYVLAVDRDGPPFARESQPLAV
jgi:hypothetical protein